MVHIETALLMDNLSAKSSLRNALGAFARTPHAGEARANAWRALSNTADAETIAAVLSYFPAALEVALLAEKRASQMNPDNEHLWERLVETYSLFADDPVSLERARSAVARLARINPRSPRRLDAECYLRNPSNPAQNAEIRNLAQQILDQQPDNIRALRYLVKALTISRDKESAMDTLGKFTSRLPVTDPLAEQARILRASIAADDPAILNQWP